MFFQYENPMIKLNNKIKHGNILMLFSMIISRRMRTIDGIKHSPPGFLEIIFHSFPEKDSLSGAFRVSRLDPAVFCGDVSHGMISIRPPFSGD